MTKRLQVDCRVAPAMHYAFDLEPGCCAVVGPSGAGKSSLLALLAGLRRPDAGTVRWGDQILDQAGTRGAHVPPHQRGFGWVAQRGLLFPHLDVRRNLLYSPRAGGGSVSLDDVVEVLSLGPLLRRRTNTLSGGEAQRVALGRALLAQPEMLLLDEPVSALDLSARLALMAQVRRVHETLGVPVLFVSHDPELVLRFATQTLVLRSGEVVAQGAPRLVLDRLAGGDDRAALPNLIAATIRDGGKSARIPGDIDLRVPGTGLADGTAVWLRILSTDLLLMRGSPDALSARNVLPGVVRRVTHGATRAVVEIEAGALWHVHVVPSTVEALGLAEGESLQLVAKATSFDVLPRVV